MRGDFFMAYVGLVTPYRIDNYGTKLQAYAMQKLIEIIGFDSEIVDYYPKYDKRPHILIRKIVRKFRRKTGKVFVNENTKRRHEALEKFDEIYKKSGVIKGYGNLRSCSKNYCCFVCGSDQIWESGNMITDYYNLNFVDNKPRISYAASFGAEKIAERYISEYRKFLSRMDSISVREKSGLDIVRKITGKDAVQVLDPTVAVGVQVWNELCGENDFMHKGERYIFCYFLGDNESHREMAEKLSKKTELMLVSLPHMKKYVEADEKLSGKKLYDVTPKDFLNYIKYAEYVCTDSFHGTVFSILFGREFFVFNRFSNSDANSTNTRIRSLLTVAGLENRLTGSFEDMEKNLSSVTDYDKTNKLLNVEIEKSRKFLADALGKL